MDDHNINHWIWTKSDPFYHESFPISRFIPMETLVYGYIRSFEKESKLFHDVPQGVVKLIISYYI